VEALGINLGFLIAQLINFGVIFLLLAVVAWRPLVRVLDDRGRRIAQQIEDAEVAAKARANAEAEAAKIIDEARRNAAGFAEEARSRGEDSAKGILEEARTDAEKILADSRQKASEEHNRQLAELRGQVATLAIAAAQKLIGEAMDEKRQRAQVEKFFTEAPEAAAGLGGAIEVVTALPLTEAEQADVKKRTKASEITFVVDPGILGGMIVHAGDRVIDGSMRAGLREIAGRLN
jgi:F-type H+-transporting ATPase subunit b